MNSRNTIKKSKANKRTTIPLGSDFSMVEDSADISKIMTKILKEAGKNAEAEAVAHGLPRIITKTRSLVLVTPDGKEKIVYTIPKGEKPFFLRARKKGTVLHAVKSK